MINEIFSFKPVDTLFFRGSEPMVMGENHSSNFNFPPPVHTVEGAIRTLLYFKDKNKYRDIIRIGEKKGDFNIIGPMFLVSGEIFVPAPYSWYKEKSQKSDKPYLNKKSEETKELRHISKFAEIFKKTEPIKVFKSTFIEGAGLIKTKSNKIYWVKADNGELVSIGGNWINFNDLISDSSEKVKVFSIDQFFNKEPRTGIALKGRTVRKSHIYTFTHARLMEDVEIIFGVDKNMPFEDEEILTLGAEQRFGSLKRLKNFENFKEKFNSDNKNGEYMSLSIIEGNKEANEHIIASGQIKYIGGWDLHKRFHKGIVGYYPAGTVFDERICNGLVSI